MKMNMLARVLSFALACTIGAAFVASSVSAAPADPLSPYTEACKFLVSIDHRVNYILLSTGKPFVDEAAAGAFLDLEDKQGHLWKAICYFKPMVNGRIAATSLNYGAAGADFAVGVEDDYLATLNKQLSLRVWQAAFAVAAAPPVGAESPYAKACKWLTATEYPQYTIRGEETAGTPIEGNVFLNVTAAKDDPWTVACEFTPIASGELTITSFGDVPDFCDCSYKFYDSGQLAALNRKLASHPS